MAGTGPLIGLVAAMQRLAEGDAHGVTGGNYSSDRIEITKMYARWVEFLPSALWCLLQGGMLNRLIFIGRCVIIFQVSSSIENCPDLDSLMSLLTERKELPMDRKL